MKKKSIVWVILVAIVIIICVSLVVLIPKIKAYMPYYYDLNGKNQKDIPYTLVIEKSDFANEVIKELYDNGIICSSVRFWNYIEKNYPDFVWYNGIYQLNANMSYEELCNALMNPNQKLNYVKFTVPEGKTVVEIAEIVEKSGLCSAKGFLEAADSYDYDFSFMTELKKRDQSKIAYKLEGYLFPATYEFRADTVKPKEIVEKMLKTFTEYVSREMIDAAAKKGLSLNEFITFGAVVQAEAFSKESMGGVASVFWNRLNSKTYPRLQSDPTMFYAQSLKDLPHYSKDMKNSYDTYVCSDLPVAPTNCPGTDVLNAVLNPSETEYFYFVTDKNGKFYFNETLQGHNRTINSLKNKGLWA